MPSLLAKGKEQYFDNSGAPLVGGKLFTYVAGTTTPKATYADNLGAVANPNPVILDGRGEAVIFWSGSYDVVLQDALGNVIWSVQNVAESALGTRTSSNGATITPAGTTAQRDAVSLKGYLRYNTDLDCFEGYYGGWQSILKSVNGIQVPDGGNVPLKTVGGVSITGAGDIAVQSPLVSGTNIKTLAGQSILGAGNLVVPSFLSRSARVANAILTGADSGTFIDVTANTFTQTFTAAATLGAGWWCYYRNSGTGNITIPSSDGVANWIMYPGEARLFICDGANFYSAVLETFTANFTSTVAFTKPPGYTSFDVELWGAGGGGAGGASYYPGMGGAGGGYAAKRFLASELSFTTTVVVGGGGAGSVGINTASGTAGGNGGSTGFLNLTATGGTGAPLTANTGYGAAASGGVGCMIFADPYIGANGPAGSSASGANGTGKLLAGASGGGGAGTGYVSGAGGIRVSMGTAAPAVAVNSNAAGAAGSNFGGGAGGGAGYSTATAGGNGGNGGLASGGGGGGGNYSGSGLPGNGGNGGNGYATIRGVY